MHLGDLRRLRVLLHEVSVGVTRDHPGLRSSCYRFLMGACTHHDIDVQSHHTRTYFTVCAKNWLIITLQKRKQ